MEMTRAADSGSWGWPSIEHFAPAMTSVLCFLHPEEGSRWTPAPLHVWGRRGSLGSPCSFIATGHSVAAPFHSQLTVFCEFRKTSSRPSGKANPKPAHSLTLHMEPGMTSFHWSPLKPQGPRVPLLPWFPVSVLVSFLGQLGSSAAPSYLTKHWSRYCCEGRCGERLQSVDLK